MRRFMILLALLFGLGLTALPAPADADSVATMHLMAPGATFGGVTLVTGGPLDLSLVSMGGLMSGDAFLGILVPNGTASVGVSIGSLETTKINFASGQLGDASNLNEPGLTNFQFNAIVSASAQVGVTATSFTAYDWDLGAYSSTQGTGGLTFTVNSLPTGTVIVAWLEDGAGNAIERTPLSESLTVPEPSILILLGLAMSTVGIVSRFVRKI